MKTKYKILIISLIAVFVYHPGIPLLSLGCQQVTANEICFDIGALRIPNPVESSTNWDTGN